MQMDGIEKSLQEVLNKKNVLKDEPMSNHTSFRIGGNAEYFLKIDTIEKLKKVLDIANKNNIKVTIVGNGTNLLVQEGGIKGFVIKLELKAFKIKNNVNDVYITVESGMSVSTLSNIAIKEEIEGIEFLAGIPGTIGGALRMNAGAYGHEMKDIVYKTRYMTYDGKIKVIDSKDHKFSYRNSIFSKINVIILDTTLKLKRGNIDDIKSKVNENMKSRLEHQPLDYPNAGSIFKRKENYITSKLIDECGLKGYSIGDAEVSKKHAGFIVNTGNATSKDVLQLIEYIKKKVKDKFNIDIETEIIVLGDEE